MAVGLFLLLACKLSPGFYLGSNKQYRQFHASTQNVLVCAILHCESKKLDTKLLAIISLTIIRFSKFFSLDDLVVNLQRTHV